LITGFKHEGAVGYILPPDIDIERGQGHPYARFDKFVSEPGRVAFASGLTVQIRHDGTHRSDIGMRVQPVLHRIT
jgi:hypothetical protein